MSQALSPVLAAIFLTDSSQGPYEVEVIVTPIFQMWKLRFREVKGLT